MDATNELNPLAHTADTIKSTLLAIVLRHYGLELRQESPTSADSESSQALA
jgi:hypothetical protein